MEGTADGEEKSPFRTGFLQFGAGFLDRLLLTGDDHLAGGIEVDWNHYPFYSGAYFLNGPVVQGYDCGHGTGDLLAAGLHGHGTGIDQTQTVLETQASGCRQRREFSKGVACDHIRAETVSQTDGGNYGMKEDGRLCDTGLLQVLFRPFEHCSAEAETEYPVGFVEEILRPGVALI